jgi:hypothetical protein
MEDFQRGRPPAHEPGDEMNDPAHSDALSSLPRPDRSAISSGVRSWSATSGRLTDSSHCRCSASGGVSSNVRRRPRSSVTVSSTAERPRYRTSTSRIVVVGVSAL